MTPREARWRIEDEVNRENRELERVAQLACWVVNPWIEKRENKMHVSNLVSRRGNKRAEATDWDEWAKD